MRFPIAFVLLAAAALAGETAASDPSSAASAQRAPGARPAASPPADTGEWKLAVETSRKDGSKSITATLAANAPIRSGFGEVTPSLVLRYRAGRTSAYVVFDTFLGSGSTIDARVTIGQEPAEVQKWNVSTDGRAAFVPGEALAFMDRLKQANAFSIQVAPRKDQPVTASFTPTGIEWVIKALISAGVKYGG